MINYSTETRGNITVTVKSTWKGDVWSWYASRGHRDCHGECLAVDEVDAIEQAFSAAKMRLWTVDEILEREA